jgi:RNA polymerase sigma-70 factor (family 1)
MRIGDGNTLDDPLDSLKYQIAVYEDAVAYKSLFFLMFPSLQNFAFSFLKSRSLAEETASDVLMEVWIRRKKLLAVNNLKLYLFTSVKNAALKKIQQERRGIKVSLEELGDEIVSDYAIAWEQSEKNELEAGLQEAIRQLPPRCKLIYKLAKEDKLKYAEIAELLGISIKTIDNQLSIAVQKISAAIRQLHTRKK